MSLAVGETHGKGVSDELPAPRGVECIGPRFDGEEHSTFSGSVTLLLEGPYPWVSPTANDSVPLRGTHECPFECSFVVGGYSEVGDRYY
jgi:hypothetical protein